MSDGNAEVEVADRALLVDAVSGLDAVVLDAVVLDAVPVFDVVTLGAELVEALEPFVVAPLVGTSVPLAAGPVTVPVLTLVPPS